MKSLHFILVLLITFYFSNAEDCGDKDSSNEVALHRKLLCKYDRDNRPVKNHNTAVNVTIRMLLKLMLYSSQWSHAETITLKTWMTFRWRDEFLTWRPDDYGGLTSTLIHSSKIWIPDMSLYNNPEPTSSAFNYPCTVTNDGDVTCIPQMNHVGVCPMNYKNWPYDRQNCTLVFGTWMHKGEQVNFVLPKIPINLSDYKPNKYWKLISANVTRHHGVYACCPNATYPSLRYSFIIERQTATLVTLLVTPAIVMLSMTIISLWLDIISLERIILMFFNIACHFFYLSNLESYIPSNGTILPDALIYFRDTTILSCIVLFHCILLRNLVVYTQQVPQWATRIIGIMNTSAGKIVFHEFDPAPDSANIVVEDAENLSKGELQASMNKEWKKLALFINRIFSIVVILTYIVLILVYLL